MSLSRLRSLYYVCMVVVLWLAFWLRMSNLATLPPGLSSDEAINIVDSFHLSQTLRFPFYENYGDPEPLHRLLFGLSLPFVGAQVFVFRWMSVLIGMVTIATVAWVSRQCAVDYSRDARWVAGMVAAGSLAVALGHIVLSRSLYRAMPQPLLMLLFIGFALRGLRTYRIRDYLLSGTSLGLSLYSYTAAFVVPLALITFTFSQLLFQHKAWRKWIYGLILIVIAFAIVITPILLILWFQPWRVIGRANEVGGGLNLANVISHLEDRDTLFSIWRLYFVRGDGNPQYNVEYAPILPPAFRLLFLVGLAALWLRIHRPASLTLFVLPLIVALPVILSNENPHGLRIAGAFAAFPLVVGTGVAWLLYTAQRTRRRSSRSVYFAMSAASVILIVGNAAVSHQVYEDYWRKPYTTRIFGLDLPLGEWFFRTDLRDFSTWVNQQQSPLLIPLEELEHQITHGWLLNRYPRVMTTPTDNFSFPAGTRLVLPWALRLGDYNRNATHYALLNKGVITILPPISLSTREILTGDLDQANVITREGVVTKIALVKALPNEFQLAFESPAVNGSIQSPIIVYKNGMGITSWSGSTLLNYSTEQEMIFTINWFTRSPQWNDHRSFVGILTHDLQRKAGVDAEMHRWFYPTWVWAPYQVVPVPYKIKVPAGLNAGAYRFVASVQDEIVTIGWLKVPQREMPLLTAGRLATDIVIGGKYKLYGVSAFPLENGRVRTSFFWESLDEPTVLDPNIFIHLHNGKNDLIAQVDGKPMQGNYPTFIWSKGERIQTDYELNIGNTPLDEVDLWMGMYTFPSLERLPIMQNGSSVKDARVRIGKLSELVEK